MDGRQEECGSALLSALLTVHNHFSYLFHCVHVKIEQSLEPWVFVPCSGQKVSEGLDFLGNLAEVTDHSHVNENNNSLFFSFRFCSIV